MTKVHISDHFTFKNIFKATLFPIVMMVFSSLYTIVDGIFIANFASKSGFAAVNLVFPFIMIIGGFGFMMGTGGTALVSKLLGEQQKEKANKVFSLIIYVTLTIGIVLSIAGFFLVPYLVRATASVSELATEEMINEAILYGRILMATQFIYILQNTFQSFFMVAEKTKLGFIFVLGGGISNMILDAVFIGLLRWGVVGAACATIAGYVIAGIGPLIYFACQRRGIIFLSIPDLNIKNFFRSAYNGISEFVSNISMNVVAIIYNIQLLKMYGENGVSAYGIIMYLSFVFVAIFIGYSLGMAPAVGYNYGAKNKEEMRNILKKSLIIISIISILMAIISFLTASTFSNIFAGDNEELARLSTYAMRIYSIAFLACGFSIYISSFFTALNNGTISGILSLSRTFVFQVLFGLTFPLFLPRESIWWAIASAEIVSAFACFLFLLINKKKYGY